MKKLLLATVLITSYQKTHSSGLFWSQASSTQRRTEEDNKISVAVDQGSIQRVESSARRILMKAEQLVKKTNNELRETMRQAGRQAKTATNGLQETVRQTSQLVETANNGLQETVRQSNQELSANIENLRATMQQIDESIKVHKISCLTSTASCIACATAGQTYVSHPGTYAYCSPLMLAACLAATSLAIQDRPIREKIIAHLQGPKRESMDLHAHQD